jgi:hypothetical protein
MTISEYEERFRPPAPSLHQTFTEVRGPNGSGRAEPTPLGYGCLNRCNGDNIEGRVASLLSC